MLFNKFSVKLCLTSFFFFFFLFTVSASNDFENEITNVGFVQNDGQVKGLDNLWFSMHHRDMFVYFLSDRIVFISQEVENIPNEKSLNELSRGNQNLADKYSAVTTAHRFELIFNNSNSNVYVKGENAYPYEMDFYLGHCQEGILNVNSYKKIRYENIYDGIDLVFYLDGETLKYQFELSVGISPSVISFQWEGIENSHIDELGVHNFTVGNLNLKDNAPVSFCQNKEIKTKYKIDNNIMSFEVDEYNDTEELIIDPGLLWASSLEYNGYGSWGALVTNSSGEFYIVDWEWSPGLTDLTGYLASAGTSSTFGSDNTNNEVIISKFSTNGDLLWACQYGGSGDDDVNGGIALDDNDNLYITGTSQKEFSAGSGDFPLQTWGSAFYQAWDGSLGTGTRGYIIKFLPDNSRQWATYLDRGANLEVFDLECGLTNNMYLTGKSGSYPTRIQAGSIPSGSGYSGALNGTGTAHNFILEFDSNGSLTWATWLPGETASTYTGRCSDIAVNRNNGNFYIAGDDMWNSTTRFNAGIISDTYTNQGSNDMFYLCFNGSNQPVSSYGKYIGGAGFDKINIGAANGDIELDPDGDLYLCGHTYSADFPVVDPGGCAYFDGVINDGSGISSNVASTQDGYLVKVNTSGTISYGTFFGGADYSSMKQLKKDSYDNLWICGAQNPSGLSDISHIDYFNQAFAGTSSNLMFAQLRDDDYLEWLSYYGFTAGYSGYFGFDIFEPAVDNIELYLAGKFSGLTPIGGGYQFTNSSSCTGASKFLNILSVNEPDAINPNVATYCSVDQLTVSGTLPVGATWEWYTGSCGGTNVGSGATLNIAPTVPTTYYVQAEGACVISNCTSITVTPLSPPAINVDFSTICDGETANLTATSGYTSYLWSTGSTSDAISVSPSLSTMYYVTVTDLNGCTADVSTTVNVNPIPVANASNTGPYCEGNTINLSTTNVTAGTYVWDGPGAFSSTGQSPSISGCVLTDAGIYNVTVTANGCTNTSSTTVVVNPGPTSSATNTGPYCAGDNISLSCTAISGATYSWDGPNAFTSGLQEPVIGGCAVTDGGVYNLTVTLGSCSSISSTNVNVNSTPASLATSTAPYCVGDDINLSTTMVAGATYAWSGPSGFSSNLQNPVNSASDLTDSGVYSVTVSLSGCTSSSSTTVSVNSVPSLGLGINTAPLCNGDNNGIVDVNISSGTADYSVDWGSGSYVTSNLNSTISGIAAGNIDVTVTDLYGCTDVQNINVNQPGVLNASVSGFQNQNCSTPGQATVIGVSGTSPYTYNWPTAAGGVSGGAATNLSAGTYNVTVVDDNLCQFIQSVVIVDVGSMSVNSYVTNPISCYGESDGEITIDISGGMPNFVFNNGTTTMTSGTFSNSLNGLSVGNYTFTVTDAMGCTSVENINLTEPAQITSSVSAQTEQVCLNLGSATISANNGIIPYQYFWPVTAGGASGSTANALNAGTYVVTVQDANLCSVEQTITISDIGAISASVLNSSDPLCFNAADGTISIDIIGGTPDFAIDFGAGSFATTTSPYTINGLSSGNYDITITDFNGCSCVVSETLSNPLELAFTTNINNHVTCNGLSDASIEVVPLGGTPAYSIVWSDPTLSGMSQSTLSVGDYDFTVTDANACSANGTISINEPIALSATESTIDALCAGDDASATITPLGGTPPYDIAWEDGSSNFTNNSIPVNSVQGYTVTDANTCTFSNSIFMSNPPPFTVSLSSTDVTCNGNSDGVAMVDEIIGGVTPISYEWNDGQVSPQINSLDPGIYSITLTDNNLCQALAQIEIFEPDEITVVVTTTNADCSGAPGSAGVTASGGVGTLLYSWNCTSEITPDVIDIIPGIHEVTVTDDNLCESVTSFEITSQGSINVALNQIQDVLCYGNANGTLEAVTGSVNSPYTYIWSIGGNTQQMSGLPAGDYSVTITDSWGCVGNSQITISEPEEINISANIDNIGCLGETNGAIHLSVSGGSPEYSYEWSDGSNLPYIQNLSPGNYLITVTDANFCTLSDTYEIVQSNNNLEINAEVINITCFGEENGELHLTTIGGTDPTNFVVTSDDYISSSNEQVGLSAGTYAISAIDANGCSDYIEVAISQPGELSASAYITHPSCYGNNDGTISVATIGGTAPYQYFLDGFPMFIDTLSFGAGSYEVSITDANGCEINLGKVNLIDDPLIECLRIPNAFSPNGDGINDTWIIENLDVYDAVYIQLFNRWGQEMCKSRDLDFEWDGVYNGKLLPTGTYLYVVNIFERDPYVGMVTIVH